MTVAQRFVHYRLAHCALLLSILVGASAVVAAADKEAEKDAAKNPVAVAKKLLAPGEPAKDFRLPAVAGQHSGEVQFSQVNASGPVVIVLLRGYPGSQCPACTAQVADLVKHADQFAAQKAQVLLIYPGAKSLLGQRADEFLQGTRLPKPLTFLLDPDLKFTKAYGLRWDAPNETSYPSTIIVDKQGKIAYLKISETHRGRSTAKEILAEL